VANPARIAILGPGGIGKTTLAQAILHNQDILAKYGQRYFVSCESATTAYELVNTVGLYVGLEPSRQLSKAIIQHFSKCSPTILVLDNLDTVWETDEYRDQVEEFLASLSGVQHLALLVSFSVLG
jgi:GTPase SAR1 family protein